MTEQNLIDLKFVKEINIGDECSDDTGHWWIEGSFYYYVYDFALGLSLISSANTEIINDEWYIDIFNTEPTIRFNELKDVESFIKLVSDNKCA